MGASASGIQIAEELHCSGRPVTLAVGEHVRMPRTYRGMDILWWMDASGLLDERYNEIPDLVRARRLPSMQLVGSPERKTLDLNALRRVGVRLVGRLAGIRDGAAQFSGSLANVSTLADLKLRRLLDTFDQCATEAGADVPGDPERLAATEVPGPVPLALDLRSGEIQTIIWATGFRPDQSWLNAPVFDRKGPRQPRRRREREPRPPSHGHAVSASAQVESHRRRRGADRPPCSLPRRCVRNIRWTTTTT